MSGSAPLTCGPEGSCKATREDRAETDLATALWGQVWGQVAGPPQFETAE
jgi:hypothetical protein